MARARPNGVALDYHAAPMLLTARSLVLASCALVACTAGDGAPLDARRAAAAAPAIAATASPTEPDDHTPDFPMPRPYRKRLGAAVSLDASCVGCHERQAAEWRGSLHRRASLDPAYQTALAVEPSPFCRGCHAPEADPTVAAPTAASALGVACVTCHVTEEGYVLAAAAPDGEAATGGDEPHEPPTHSFEAPHPVRRSVDFARTGACAGCHEFPFPGSGGVDDRHFMQTTVREHDRSPARDRACADCHMPLVDGARSHAFAQTRDPAWLAKNLEASAEQSGDSVRITLAQPAPGHGFPTGDLFRRLEVGCELRGAGGRVLARDVRYLARHFQILPGSPSRQLVRDDRVGSEPAVVDLELAPAAPVPTSARLSWWVTYQRVATVGAGTDPAAARIESEVRLHSGVLPWETN